MKKFSAFPAKTVLFLLVSISLGACKEEISSPPDALDKDTSYAFGMLMGEQMSMSGLRFEYTSFMEGFKAVSEAQETRLTQDQMTEKITTAISQVQAKQNSEYLAQNGARAEVTTTSSGLQYEVITPGSGEKPGPADVVEVHYEGALIDGTVFDSSYQRGAPLQFPVGGVIPGWVEGLQLMNVGSAYRFVIPGDLAYGANPPPGGPIPPNSVLVFRVELLSIVKQ